jgi:TolA-binding protein
VRLPNSPKLRKKRTLAKSSFLRLRSLKIVLFFILLLAIGIGLYLVPVKRPFESYTHRAEEAFQKKNFNRSIELYLKALKLYPNHERTPQVLLMIGDTYNFSLGNVEKAGTAYSMLTNRFSHSPEARQGFQHAAEMYEKNENYEKALLAYQGVVDNFPQAKDIDEFRFEVAMMALKLKKFEPARLTLMSIVEKNPATPIADRVLYQLGNVFFMEGSSKEAIEVLKVAVEKYPESPLKTEMQFSMANAYEEIGKLDEALKIYKSILNLYPNPKVVEKKIEKLMKKNSETKDIKQQILQATKKPNPETQKSSLSQSESPKKTDKKIKSKALDLFPTPDQIEP